MVSSYLPAFDGVFSKPQMKDFAGYITGLIISSDRTISAMNDLFYFHNGQGALNNFNTDSTRDDEKLDKARYHVILNGLMAGGSSPRTTVARSDGTFYPPDGGATEYAYASGIPDGIRPSGQLSTSTRTSDTNLAILNSVTASVINSFRDHDIALSPTYPALFPQITNTASPALAGAGILFGIPCRPLWCAIYPYAPMGIIGLISVAAYLVVFLLPKLMRFLQNKSHR